jgi:hypothetical protein
MKHTVFCVVFKVVYFCISKRQERGLAISSFMSIGSQCYSKYTVVMLVKEINCFSDVFKF